MSKKVKKVDPKMQEKIAVSKAVADALESAGFEVNRDAESFGFTKATLVVAGVECDVQVKFITPKTGMTRYEVVEDEDEAE